MPDTHYINPKLAEIYDIDSPWSVDRDFYFQLAGSMRKTILDLGCGTGLLCDAYAGQGHDVTGVDPSEAMLDVGRRKAHGHEIEWVCSTAQSFSSDKRFDLIIMTGHAFQVLLEESDVAKTFSNVRRLLKSDGLFVFEARNPCIDWKAQWDYDMDFDTPFGKVTESRRFLDLKNNRMTFELRYELPDETLTSISELRFTSRLDIVKQLDATDLRVDKVFGDWDGKAFDETTSDEIIFFASPA